MSSRCDAEMCPNWTGHGCICEVMDLDRADRDECCGVGPHLWTDTGGGVEVCECCGDEQGD